MSRIALVIAGGDPPPLDLLATLPPPLITVAADSGINHARAMDLGVDVLVGDLDSADAAAIQWAIDRGATVEAHSPNKDQTDLELALDRAVGAATKLEIDELVVAGVAGGRLDHWLANLLTVAGPVTASIDVTTYAGRSRISVVRNHRLLTGRAGELISLIPVGGPAHGITTTGLTYPLTNETLTAGSGRGVSNTFVSTGTDTTVSARVELTWGTLLAVQPEYLASTP